MSSTATGPGLYRLSARARKLLLVIHIAAAGAWLGVDLALGILVVTTLTAGSAAAAAGAASIAAVATWPLITVGALTLLTGVALGLGSKYRLARYWWVLVKLALNIVLLALVVVVLSPMVVSVSDDALTALTRGVAQDAPAALLFPPVVSSVVLVIAITLSVFKPWGRVTRQPARLSAGRVTEVQRSP